MEPMDPTPDLFATLDSDSERIASSLGASSSQSDITSLTMPQLLAKAQQVSGDGLDRLVAAKDMQALAEALVLLGRLLLRLLSGVGRFCGIGDSIIFHGTS